MDTTNQSPYALRQADVLRHFDRAADGFGDADFVHRHCFDGLLERLSPVQLEPARILDLGCAAGAGSRALAKRYRRARITSLDLSPRMLQQARQQRSRFARISELQASAEALPFATGSFDLVVANLLLPWLNAPDAAYAEIRRVLRKDGLFAFATLGPDSLLPLRQAWAAEDEHAHVNLFADMHNVGDALVRAGLADPVLDVDGLVVSYPDVDTLLRDLRAAGGNALLARRPALTGKSRLGRVRAALAPDGGPLAVELELVFGHAWGSGPPSAPGEFRIDPGAIGRFRA